MTFPPSDLSAVPRDAVFEQLERILSTQAFQTSKRSSQLLRFLIEQSVSGRPERLKEYEIGTEVLGKGREFDPRTDPIVRSEISRLRTRLEKYYATAGQTDPLIIELPKGSYLPQIQTRPQQWAGIGTSRERRPWGFGRLGWLAGGVAMAVSVIAVALFSQLPRTSAPANVSIAVLPFANLSGDPSQAFFSDGMTQEITTALAAIPDLRVVARGSASQFKGVGQDLRAVGRTLGASHLIEGSVRKDGERVRITAQLVSAEDGVNIWVGSYNRELDDVFAIQEEIATAIAGALRIPLGMELGGQLVANRAIDPESYEQFLRGKAEMQKARRAFAQQIALLEPVVARNPGYAPAWGILAKAYRNAGQSYELAASQSDSPKDLLRSRDTYLQKSEEATRRAIELDRNSVDALIMQATIQAGLNKWALADALISKAVSLDPTHPEALEAYTNFLLMVGRVKESVSIKRRLREIEPYAPLFAGNFVQALWLDGQADAALAVANGSPDTPGPGRSDLPRIYASLGRYEEAATALSRYVPLGDKEMAPAAEALLRSAPDVAELDSLPRLGRLGFVYAYVGAPERMLEYYEQALAPGVELAYLWHPSYETLHKSERFKKFVQKVNLVDYWRERGWPSFCKPLGPDDFTCE